MSFNEWRKNTTAEMLTLPKSYQETVFRNAILTAHNASKWTHFRDNANARPILRYSAINDSRTRPAHKALHGLMMPINDPRWQSIAPPNGHNCRCTLMSLSERQAKAFGYEGAPAELPNYKDKHGHDTPAHPDNGWANSPENPDLTAYLREKERKHGLPAAVFDSSKANTLPAGGVWPPVEDGTAETAIIREIVQAGRADGKEHGILADALGNIIDRRSGTESSIDYHGLLSSMAGMTLYHNHPSNSFLSTADIYLLMYSGLHEIVALGTTDKAIYRAVLHKRIHIEELNAVKEEIAQKVNRFQQKKSSLSEQDARLLIAYTLVKALEKQGVLSYHHEMSKRMEKLEATHAARIEKWISGLKK